MVCERGHIYNVHKSVAIDISQQEVVGGIIVKLEIIHCHPVGISVSYINAESMAAFLDLFGERVDLWFAVCCVTVNLHVVKAHGYAAYLYALPLANSLNGSLERVFSFAQDLSLSYTLVGQSIGAACPFL